MLATAGAFVAAGIARRHRHDAAALRDAATHPPLYAVSYTDIRRRTREAGSRAGGDLGSATKSI